ncbi:MAG TPA: TOBE domain-containing protein [Parasulfuritortus sp.]
MEPRFSLPSVIKTNNITNFEAWLPPVPKAACTMGPNLLERLAELGSLHDAASSLGLDQELAWDYLVAANNLADVPLLRPHAASLTPTRQGRNLLCRSENLARDFQDFLDAPSGGAFRQFQLRHQFLRRLAARTSARNQFYCRIRSVRRERVNAVVTLDLGGTDQLAAHITAHSAEELGLVGGRACHALIEPAWVEVLPDSAQGLNGRHNCLRGRVVRCLEDPVDTEVAIELAGGRIVIAAMAQAEMADKGVAPGRTVCVLIQSSQIILAVDQSAADSTVFLTGGQS